MANIKTTQIEYTQQGFKLACMYFANMEVLAVMTEAVKDTPFYQTSCNRLINQLKAELSKHFRMVKQLNPSVVIDEQFNLSKMLTAEFLQTLGATDPDKFTELAALLKLYREGNLRFENEPVDVEREIKED